MVWVKSGRNRRLNRSSLVGTDVEVGAWVAKTFAVGLSVGLGMEVGKGVPLGCDVAESSRVEAGILANTGYLADAEIRKVRAKPSPNLSLKGRGIIPFSLPGRRMG